MFSLRTGDTSVSWSKTSELCLRGSVAPFHAVNEAFGLFPHIFNVLAQFSLENWTFHNMSLVSCSHSWCSCESPWWDLEEFQHFLRPLFYRAGQLRAARSLTMCLPLVSALEVVTNFQALAVCSALKMAAHFRDSLQLFVAFVMSVVQTKRLSWCLCLDSFLGIVTSVAASHYFGATVAFRAISRFCDAHCADKETELVLGCSEMGTSIVTLTALFHCSWIFNSCVAAFGVMNEWWNCTVTVNACQGHSRDDVAVLMKRLSWSLDMSSELAGVDGAWGFWRQGGRRASC